MLKSFSTTVATPRKCPGRNAPSRMCWRSDVHAHVFHHFRIGLQGARIALEILLRPELDPVDEYADDGARRAMLRQAHQLDVARVEIAHGRDEDVVGLALQPLAQIPHRSDDVHRVP